MTIAKPLNRITLEEFEKMEKDERLCYEFIDGIILMSPSPSYEHQKIGTRIVADLVQLLSKASCDVLYEYDVKFKEDVYRPDISVFCNNDRNIPAIVIEILSPSTRQRDLLIKPMKYQAMGVKEYWIADPKSKTITVHDFIFETSETYIAGETIQSQTYVEIVITVNSIFS